MKDHKSWDEFVEKEYEHNWGGDAYVQAKLLAAIADSLDAVHDQIYALRKGEKK